MFADITLNNGVNQTGINEFIDIFTWGGWAKAFYFAIIYYAVRYFIINTYYALSFALIYMLLPTTRFCGKGEWMAIGIDLCEEFGLIGA